MTEKAAPTFARTVLQQCLHARLQVKPADEDTEAEWVEIDRGMVIYVCFFKGATEEVLPKMVSTLMNLRLCESDSGKYMSVLELPGSVLVVPQATLGGRAKGKVMQYHGNVGKEEGLQLYSSFVSLCEKQLLASTQAAGKMGPGVNETGTASGAMVKHGTYGNRQVLKLDTNGPYTHLMEF